MKVVCERFHEFGKFHCERFKDLKVTELSKHYRTDIQATNQGSLAVIFFLDMYRTPLLNSVQLFSANELSWTLFASFCMSAILELLSPSADLEGPPHSSFPEAISRY